MFNTDYLKLIKDIQILKIKIRSMANREKFDHIKQKFNACGARLEQVQNVLELRIENEKDDSGITS